MYMITTTAALVKSMSPLKATIRITAIDSAGKVMIPSPTSQNYYYEAWVYLTAAVLETTPIAEGTPIANPFTSVSNIVSRFDTSKKDVGLAVFKNKTTGNYTLCVLAGTTTSVVPYFVTENLPINKWVYLVMNVSGKLVEVYVNGKLLRTIYLATSVPRSADAPIYIGLSNGLDGYITRAIRKPENIDPTKVWDQYLQGNGQYGGALYGLLDYINSYAFKMDITSNGKIQREFTAQIGSTDTK